MRKLQSLVPAFLKELDKKWLIEQPALWATRIHFVLFYGGIGLGLSYLFAAIIPMSTHFIPNISRLFVIISIFSLGGILFWAYRVSWFKVERQYGLRYAGDRLREQLIYLFAVLFIASAPFIFHYQISRRISSLVDDRTFVREVNSLNLGFALCFPNHGYFIESKSRDNEYLYKEVEVKEKAKDIRTEKNIRNTISDFVQTFNKYNYHKHPFSTDLSEKELVTWVQTQKDKVYSQSDDSSEEYLHHGSESYDYQVFGEPAVNYVGDKYYRIDNKIRLIEQAKSGLHAIKLQQYREPYLYLLGALFILVLVYFQTDARMVSLSLGTGAVLSILFGFIISGMVAFFQFQSQILFSLGLFITLGFLFYQVHREKNTAGMNVWKSLCLSLAVILTPCIPFGVYLVFENQTRGDDFVTALGYVGIGLTLVLWNLLYHARFQKIFAHPMQA